VSGLSSVLSGYGTGKQRWSREKPGIYRLWSPDSTLPHALVDRGATGYWWWIAWGEEGEISGQCATLAQAKSAAKGAFSRGAREGNDA